MTHTLLEVQVRGRVQGVGYRAWCRGAALERGISGWVRNEADGTVTARLAGPEDAVQGMLRAMERGPSYARVTGIDVVPAPEEAEPGAGFLVLR